MDEEFDVDKFLRELHSDVPLIHRLGFFSDVFVDYLVEFEDVAAKLRELGESKEPFVDEFGYLWSVTNYVIEDANRRASWVEWKRTEKDGGYELHEYLLKARADSNCFKWKIETVNPYFGCFVHQLGWSGDSVVLVYADKHSSYRATMNPVGPVQKEELK